MKQITFFALITTRMPIKHLQAFHRHHLNFPYPHPTEVSSKPALISTAFISSWYYINKKPIKNNRGIIVTEIC